MLPNEVIVAPSATSIRGTRTVGILLVIAGVLALLLPMIAGIAITAIVGWVLLLGGAAHLLFSWHARSTGAVLWQVLIGLVYLFVALYLLLHPARGLATLTLLLASYFVIEGFFELAIYFHVRGSHRAMWFLWDGLITLLLGVFIWARWPISSVWALGTLVGISMLLSGVTRLSFRTARPL